MSTQWGVGGGSGEEEVKEKHPLSKHRTKVPVPDGAITEWRWETQTCVCRCLKGTLLPICGNFSGDHTPLCWPSPRLSDQWPFRRQKHPLESMLSLQFRWRWRHCNLLNKGPRVSVATYPLLRELTRSLRRSQELKPSASIHPSIHPTGSQILHA